jgi:hypothetical protein
MPNNGDGAKAFENDIALEWMDDVGGELWTIANLEKDINEVFATWNAQRTKRRGGRGMQELRRAAAELIIMESGTSPVFSEVLVKTAISSLEELLQDKRWLKSWNDENIRDADENLVRENISYQVSCLEAILEEAKVVEKEAKIMDISAEAEAILRHSKLEKVTF